MSVIEVDVPNPVRGRRRRREVQSSWLVLMEAAGARLPSDWPSHG